MKKNLLKYGVDAAMFVVISSVAVLGFMLGFVIPRGGRNHDSFLGLGRHAWGDIHLYLSIILLFLLCLHLFLNWSWILNATKRYFGGQWKNALWGFGCAWTVVLLAAWLIAML